MDDRVLYLWLNSIKGIGPILGRRLIQTFGNIKEVYRAEAIDLLKVEGVGKGLVNTIQANKNLEKSKVILDKCDNYKIQVITKEASNYPSRLKNQEKAPLLLYGRGTLKEFEKTVAIVGSRRCSEYGKNLTVELTEALSSLNIPIISGMAKGIDGYAHTVALNNNNYTMAVLGTGVDRCYPSEHINLMNNIIENGAVISQFDLGSRNIKENFAKRNELIAMLSDNVVVIQASNQSGALYTARYGMQINKEVYTTPGNISDELSKGTNELLNEGAKPYLSVDTLLSKLGKIKKLERTYTEIEKRVLNLLKENPKSLDLLRERLIVEQDELIELTLEMEMKGYIKQYAGLYYSLISA